MLVSGWWNNCSLKTYERRFISHGTIATSPMSFFKYDFWGRTSLSFDGEEKKTFPRKCKNSLPLQSDKRLSLKDFYFGFFPLWPGSALGGSKFSTFSIFIQNGRRGFLSFFFASEITFAHLPVIRLIFILTWFSLLN